MGGEQNGAQAQSEERTRQQGDPQAEDEQRRQKAPEQVGTPGDDEIRAALAESWMYHLTTERNIAGHHDRFYNRVIAIRPKLLARDAGYESDKEFPTLLIIKNIYERSWPEKWEPVGKELVEIIDSHPRVDLRPMGFPEDWKTVLGP